MVCPQEFDYYTIRHLKVNEPDPAGGPPDRRELDIIPPLSIIGGK